jgi:hypothetical protein
MSSQQAPVPASSESAASRACHRCSAQLPADAGRCAGCGSWQFGNQAALTHGIRSEAVRRQLLEGPDAAALAEQRADVERDLGGDLSRIQQDLVGRYVETSALCSWLAGHLTATGLQTPRGRMRAAFNAYLQVLDRQHRLALALGLERRARQVGIRERMAIAARKAGEQA